MQRVNFDTFLAALPAPAPGRRMFVAVAGAPGSGKSTLAAKLVTRLNDRKSDLAALLPMDGFHFDDMLLTRLGRRARKGAPDTFDVDGLRHMLLRLRARDEDAVAVPVFDRQIEVARAGARLIPAETAIIVVEGNYLLLDRPPWSALAPLFDITVRLDVRREVLQKRLDKRWRALGLSADEIRRKLADIDLPNGDLVAAASIEPHFLLSN